MDSLEDFQAWRKTELSAEFLVQTNFNNHSSLIKKNHFQQGNNHVQTIVQVNQ